MRGRWLLIAMSGIVFCGCTSTKPSREMRQQHVEEFSTPPPKYDAPPDYPRDDRPLEQKQNIPPSMGGPNGGPGGAGMMMPQNGPGMPGPNR
jgi:hypothetical protein